GRTGATMGRRTALGVPLAPPPRRARACGTSRSRSLSVLLYGSCEGGPPGGCGGGWVEHKRTNDPPSSPVRAVPRGQRPAWAHRVVTGIRPTGLGILPHETWLDVGVTTHESNT